MQNNGGLKYMRFKRQYYIFEPPLESRPQTCRTWSYIIILLGMVPQKTREGYNFFLILAVKECNNYDKTY